jgi:hypothetical protein
LAEDYAAQSLAARRRVLGSEDDVTMQSAAILALTDQLDGKFPQAESLPREALEFIGKNSRATGEDTRPNACWEAAWPARRNFRRLSRCWSVDTRGWRRGKTKSHLRTFTNSNALTNPLVRFYEASGKPEMAAQWRSRWNRMARIIIFFGTQRRRMIS